MGGLNVPHPPFSGSLDEGCTNQEIAARLGIRVKTVESGLRRLSDRYGVPNRTSLVHLARTEGWILGNG